MHIRNFTLFAILSACTVLAGWPADASAAAVRQLEDVRTMRLKGSIVVDAGGKVVSHTIDTPIPQPLHDLLDEAIPKWSFEPGAPRNGDATLRTNMSLVLEAYGEGSSLVIRLGSAYFPDAVRAARLAELQTDKKRLAVGSSPFNVGVRIAMEVGADGGIANAAATRCSVFDVEGQHALKTRVCSDFERHVARMVKRWKVTLDGPAKAVAPFTGEAWIAFHVIGTKFHGPAYGQWRWESSTSYRSPPWIGQETPEFTADIDLGVVGRTDDQLRLREGIVGAAL